MALPKADQNSIALVTGASSGIGAELARALARRGHNVALVARRRERLDELAAELSGVRAEVIESDLSDPAGRDELARRIDELGVRVDVVCNNAGFGTYEDLVDLDRERELTQVRTNIEAVVDLTARYLPGMVERRAGAVLNVASTSAFQPIPGNATYAASKAFVLSFSEAVHTEVAGRGVTVTALCPGPVETEFQDVAGAHDFTSRVPKQLWVSAEQVAEDGIAGLEKGARVVVPGTGNRVLGALSRATPHAVLLRILRAGT